MSNTRDNIRTSIDRLTVSTASTEALLARLLAAVSTGREPGSGSSSSSGAIVPIDPAATDLLIAINHSARNLYHGTFLELPPRGMPLATVIRVWGGFGMLRADRYVERDLRTWVAGIENLLHPTTRIELTETVEYADRRLVPVFAATGGRHLQEVVTMRTKQVPARCPECSERYGYDASTGNRVSAVLVESRNDPAVPDVFRASCRSCGTTWNGALRVSKLVSAIEKLASTDRDAAPGHAEQESPEDAPVFTSNSC